jgi:hypothetical protein
LIPRRKGEIRVTGQSGRPSHSEVGEAVRLLTARRPRWRAAASRLAPWVLVLIVVMGLAACSDESDAKDAAVTRTTGQAVTTTSTSTATTAATEDQKAAVLAAYRAFWDDVVAAARTADWRSPRLDDHATGKMLDRIRSQLRGLQFQGWVARGTIQVSPRLVDLAGKKATVQDCVDTSRFRRYDPKKRQWLDSGGGQPDRQRSTLTLDAQGHWKVADSEVSGKCAG